jgi:broad specificity phosphatase PhoE
MLWLIRHGESCANTGTITSDYASIPLTDLGRRQAHGFAQSLQHQPDWIGVSPYLRAKQTAEPLQCRFPSVPVLEMPVHEFTYISPARCANCSPDSLKSHTNAYWEKLAPDYNDGEGAESFTDLMHRAKAFLSDAASRPGVGMVFTHANFIRAVLVLLSCPPNCSKWSRMGSFHTFRRTTAVPNTSITCIDLDTGGFEIYSSSVEGTPLKQSKGYVQGVPTGTYCYGYVPKPGSGFTSMDEVIDYVQSHMEGLGDIEICDLYRNRQEVRHCKYWHPTDHGFVECRHLNRRAMWIPESGDIVYKAIEYFGSLEELEKQITGNLLGDGVKECQLNRDGPDWEIEPDC